MFDTRHLFNGSIFAAIIAVTIYVWFKVYKNIAHEVKKRFIIESFIIFGALFALQYTFVMPYYYHYQQTELEAFYYKLFPVLAWSFLTFLVFLIAKYFYIKVPAEKRVRLLCEYAIFAGIGVLLLFISTTKESIISPEDAKLLKETFVNTNKLSEFLSEPSRLQDLARRITNIFIWISFYAIIRSWIYLKIAAHKK